MEDGTFHFAFPVPSISNFILLSSKAQSVKGEWIEEGERERKGGSKGDGKRVIGGEWIKGKEIINQEIIKINQ